MPKPAMNADMIIQIALTMFLAVQICIFVYQIGFRRGWNKGRRDLKDTIATGIDSMIASGKLIVMVRKDQLEKAGINVPEDGGQA